MQTLLTFDLEEFDLPEEYKQHLDKKEQVEITTQGLMPVLDLLDKYQIRATFFTTAYYAEQQPEIVRSISQKHEIGSHLYYHSVYNNDHILASKLKLEEITQTSVEGFRMPRLKSMEFETLQKAGYLYDSSMNPTYLPGRYNNLHLPTTIYQDKNTNVWEVPVSVAPLTRFPLFWLSFKNIPLSVYAYFCRQVLQRRNCLHLYYHPWEFADISKIPIPTYIKRISGEALVNRLEKLILNLRKKNTNFCSVGDFVKSKM
jgi:peptidoglycan/xylan/chitin deacetylase (PgdA/CDA1 family)